MDMNPESLAAFAEKLTDEILEFLDEEELLGTRGVTGMQREELQGLIEHHLTISGRA